MTREELERYDRQIILDRVGEEGQERLKSSSVLIIGSGGLGCPASQYLTGSGIGRIGLVDNDCVSLANLPRQILHPTENIGMNKAVSAQSLLKKLNSNVEIQVYDKFLNTQNAESIIGGYDFILDCTDNFQTKFLINDTCVLLGKPFCYAGVLEFSGQLMTYVPGEPCMRCVFEGIPEGERLPTCREVGVMGAVVGIIGCMQALEAIKYLLGIDGLLTGKICIFDGITMKTRIVPIDKKNPRCRICSENADIKKLSDNVHEYEVKNLFS